MKNIVNKYDHVEIYKNTIFLFILLNLVIAENHNTGCIVANNRDIVRNEYTLPSQIESEHFIIHYTTSNIDSQLVNNQWFNLQVNDDFSQTIIDLLESTLLTFVEDGWVYPPPDCDESITDINSTEHCINFGGNSLYDVYLSNEAAGMVVPETPYPVEPYTGGYTSYMKISTFLNAYDSLPSWAEHVVAHELHHAIQMRYGYSVSGEPGNYMFNGWFFEQSATYMENVIFTNSIHLLTMLSNCNVTTPLTYTEYGIDYPADLYQYRSALWQKYLVESYNDSSIVRILWENYGLEYSTGNPVSLFPIYNDAIAQVTQGNKTLSDAFSEYAIWRYFTGDRAMPGQYFNEASSYCTASIIDTIDNPISFFSETGGMYLFDLPLYEFDMTISSPYFNNLNATTLTIGTNNEIIINDLPLNAENSLFTNYNLSEYPQALIINSDYIGTPTSQVTFSIILNEIQLIGDINNDSQVDVLDVVQLIEYIFLYVSDDSFYYLFEEEFINSDINMDLDLNVIDIVLLVNIILGN